jgi:hypothetical protein
MPLSWKNRVAVVYLADIATDRIAHESNYVTGTNWRSTRTPDASGLTVLLWPLAPTARSDRVTMAVQEVAR